MTIVAPSDANALLNWRRLILPVASFSVNWSLFISFLQLIKQIFSDWFSFAVLLGYRQGFLRQEQSSR